MHTYIHIDIYAIINAHYHNSANIVLIYEKFLVTKMIRI